MSSENHRILFVDDAVEILEIAKESLENIGYHVVAFTNGAEALEYAKTSIGEIDVVITDHTMPNMDGDVFAGEILKLKSEMPIILVTGNSTRVRQKSDDKVGFFDIVSKPWLRADLNEVIVQALKS